MLVLVHRYLCKYKHKTFVNIFLIYSHYKPGKPFSKGAPFLATPCTTLANSASLCKIEPKIERKSSGHKTSRMNEQKYSVLRLF